MANVTKINVEERDYTISTNASLITYNSPTGILNSDNVQDAIEEVNEKKISIQRFRQEILDLDAYNTTDGQFIRWDTGEFTNITGSWVIKEFAVEGLERYLITGKNGTGTQGCLGAWYNGSTFIEPAICPNNVNENRGKSFVDYEVLAPSNATKLAVNNVLGTEVSAKHIVNISEQVSNEDLLNSIPSLLSDVKSIEDDVYSTIESYNIFKGDFLSGTGFISTNGQIATNYIGRVARCEVKPDTFYYIYRSLTDDSNNIRCVDGAGTIGKVISPNGSEHTQYRMPNYDASGTLMVGQIKTRSDTKYLDFNCYFSQTDEPTNDNWKRVMVIEVGSAYNPNFVEPQYQEYFEPYYESKLEEVEQLKQNVEELNVKNRKTLNVLCIGNSFTQDSVSYSPFIIKGLVGDDIDLNIGIAHKGGALLVQHCAAITNETQTLTAPNGSTTTYEPSSVTYEYYKYTDGANSWVKVSGNPSIQSMIQDEDWDIITLQQGSNQAALEYDYYYKPFIHKIEKKIFELINKPVHLEWFTIQGKGTTTESRYNAWSAINNNSQILMNTSGFDIISAFGTAVQNLRTINSIESLGIGGGLTEDNAHLQEGLGCLVAAYTHVITWLKFIGFDYVSIIGESTRPNVSWIESHNIPAPNWGGSSNKQVIGITEDNCFLSQIAAINAVKKPFEIVDLNGYINS